MPVQPPLAELLRVLRSEADLTLEGLAERSGVSVRTLSDIERGVSLAPQTRTIDAIATGLGLTQENADALRQAARGGRGGRGRISYDSGAAAVAPHRVADFTGREREITELLSLLDTPAIAPSAVAASVVVLSGPPGVGKTTSALEAMSRVESHPLVLWVDLDGFSANPLTPLQVLRRLLRQMPGVGEKVPAELGAAVRIWRSVTAQHPPTVLLDNAANESQVRAVLSLDVRGSVVVTSRRSLSGLESAHRVTMGPMSQEDSVALLARLIPAAQRQSGDLRELAQLCDYIPLALRIAGNRIASSPARQTADYLERLRREGHRLRMLVAGDLAVESAFALSYDDLDSATAALFRAVSIIEGSTFDARIAAAITGADLLDTEDRLDELNDLGLLEVRGGNRYRLHDLLRLFASDRLKQTVGDEAVNASRATLRSWLLGTLERAGAWFEPGRTPDEASEHGTSFPDDDTAQVWIRLEASHWWPAMQEAAAAGDHDVVVDVADSLHWFSELWADWGHWCEFFTLAVEASRALGDKRLEAMHLGYLVWASWAERGDNAESADIAREAIAAADASGDQSQIGWANFYLGVSLRRSGIFPEAMSAARVSLTAFQLAGDHDGAAQTLVLMAQCHDALGDHESAVREFERVLEHSIRTQATTHKMVQMVTQLTAYQMMTRSLTALDRHNEAVDAATRSVAVATEFGTGSRTASALRSRAVAHMAAGNLDAADLDISAALAELRAYGEDPFVMAGKTKAGLELMRGEIADRRKLDRA
jgi:transcriptional regulator with XRE-family HTH domain/tetratricopeptide (TPR) repeat protein